MTNTQKAKYHYFSTEGLVAKKSANDLIITSLVEAGKCKSGAILAYGSLSYFNVDKMRNLAYKKRVNPHELSATIMGLEFDIEMQEKFIAEHQ